MQVTYEKNGISYYSVYGDGTKEEIIRKIHEGSVKQQMTDMFKHIVGDLSQASDNLIGYALDLLSNTRFSSKVSNIQFHSDEIKFGNVKYKQHAKLD